MARNRETEVSSDMTPMIDCVFLLLIFFMCATKFRQPEGALSSWLPRDRGTQAQSKPVLNPGCRITFLKEGSQIICFADDTTIPFATDASFPDDSVGNSHRDFEANYGLTGPDMVAVQSHIEMRKDSYRGVSAKGLPVIIDFAGDVPSRYVVDIVNICKRLKIEDVAVAAPEEAMD